MSGRDGLTARPRLGDHVAARLHVVDGATLLLLVNVRSGVEALVGRREWTLLQAADGTRDLPGVVAAARRRGAHASVEHLGELVARLRAAGMLAGDGEPLAPLAPAPLPARPVVPLPGYRLRCDGQGSCCRVYPTTLLSPRETLLARAACPEVLGGGDDAEAVFTPERGSLPLAGAAVAMIDGRCAYLDPPGRCRIHARAGAAAKPAGCRLFPARFVDDGVEIRVTARPECACVLSSYGGTEGEALVAASRATELPPEAVVERLPDQVPVTRDRSWPLSRARQWSRELVLDGDPVAALLAEASRLDGRGATPRSWLEAALDELGAALGRRHDGWRSPRDLARLVPGWMLGAIDRLRGTEGFGEPGAGEAAYLALVRHGHLWLAAERPLCEELGARAARLAIARCLVASVDPGCDDPALAQPIALVEALAHAS